MLLKKKHFTIKKQRQRYKRNTHLYDIKAIIFNDARAFF